MKWSYYVISVLCEKLVMCAHIFLRLYGIEVSKRTFYLFLTVIRVPICCISEPTTTWQHCLDESTQHYYYWNTTTNEVTWEIPDEYSKYLLLLKEYEERLAKYEETMKEWEERKKEPKKK